MATYTSVADLLTSLGVGGAAPWSLYASAGSDTHPVVYLGKQALEHKAGAQCASLGLDPPEAPALQVMVDASVDPFGDFEWRDDRTVVTAAADPEPVTVGGWTGSLTRVSFESTYEGWSPEVVSVLRLKGKNEDFAQQVAAEGLAPSMFVGVTDGCRFGGNRHCVNRLIDPHGLRAQRSHLVSPWWVTDHFGDSAPGTALEAGTVIRSAHEGFPFQFRAVAMLSETWGRYAGPGFGGTWLFRVEPAA